jgi:hypothetical protein
MIIYGRKFSAAALPTISKLLDNLGGKWLVRMICAEQRAELL